jgi:hypothetical protein
MVVLLSAAASFAKTPKRCLATLEPVLVKPALVEHEVSHLMSLLLQRLAIYLTVPSI